MKTVDILKKSLIFTAKNPNHITPVIEELCAIIDRQNRRIDALDRIVNRAIDE